MVANTTPIYPNQLEKGIKSLYSGHSTRPVVVFTADATDGSRVHAINAVSGDTAANTARLYVGRPLSLSASMGTGAFVDGGGGSDTITRSSGSFVTDGWVVGDRLLAVNSTTLANDFLTTLTAVASGTLTFATATVGTAENFAASTALYRVAQLGTFTIPASAGNDAAEPSVNLLDPSVISQLLADPNIFDLLPAGYVLAVALGTALGAGEFFDVTTSSGGY